MPVILQSHSDRPRRHRDLRKFQSFFGYLPAFVLLRENSDAQAGSAGLFARILIQVYCAPKARNYRQLEGAGNEAVRDFVA